MWNVNTMGMKRHLPELRENMTSLNGMQEVGGSIPPGSPTFAGTQATARQAVRPSEASEGCRAEVP